MDRARLAKFSIGQVVKHRIFPFRGVVFDVDPVFNNTEEWWLAIPEEIRPAKDQPYYHLFAENADSEYIAYVSEQNLLPDESEEPLRHPQINEFFAQQPFHAILHAINTVNMRILHGAIDRSDQAGIDDGGRAARLPNNEISAC